MNSALKDLGFGADDRVVVVHADDVGMCHASVPAWLDLVEAGSISSASAMPACPWFPLVATACRESPALDVGVHLAITSEWATLRWGPLTTRDEGSGLVDRAWILLEWRGRLLGARPPGCRRGRARGADRAAPGNRASTSHM